MLTSIWRQTKKGPPQLPHLPGVPFGTFYIGLRKKPASSPQLPADEP